MATAAPITLQPASRTPKRFAWAVVWYNVLVILWGALVRATGSGAGCGNHWPLCNGQVIPVSPTIHTIIEFTHRQMVTGLTFAVIAMVVWIFRSTQRGSAARVFSVLSIILMVNEGFIGAMLVKLGYVTDNQSVGRVVLLSIHLSNTLLMTAALTITAVMLGTRQPWATLRARGLDRTLSVVGLIATLIVGVSGSLAALGDTLFPASSLSASFAQDLSASSPWLLRLRGIHPLSALVATAFVLWLLARAAREGRSTKWVLGFLVLQIVLGFLDVVLLAPIWLQVAHLLGADLFWVALVVLCSQIVWPDDAPSLRTV